MPHPRARGGTDGAVTGRYILDEGVRVRLFAAIEDVVARSLCLTSSRIACECIVKAAREFDTESVPIITDNELGIAALP